MKPISEPVTRERATAWGKIGPVTYQRFEVEPTDINTCMPHYLGMGHATYKFSKNDLGRIITLHTSPNNPWTCWSFVS